MTVVDSRSAERQAIREQGYCISVQECHPGCSAVSVPVFFKEGMQGVISVFGASEDFTPRFMNRLLPQAVDAAGHIGRSLQSSLSASESGGAAAAHYLQ